MVCLLVPLVVLCVFHLLRFVCPDAIGRIVSPISYWYMYMWTAMDRVRASSSVILWIAIGTVHVHVHVQVSSPVSELIGRAQTALPAANRFVRACANYLFSTDLHPV